MDAELTRIPFFSQISDESFINMTPSLNIAFNKELEKDQEKLDLAFDVLDCMISKEGQTLIADGAGLNLIEYRCSNHDGRCVWSGRRNEK